MSEERTLILVKPDGVQRGLVNKVLKRFEARGFKLVGLKLVNASPLLVSTHYVHLADCDFFLNLVTYMTSGPVCAAVLEGSGVVAAGRMMLGATFPAGWRPGTIRGDYCQVVERCVAHASDSEETAAREIALWFPEGIVTYAQTLAPMLRP